MRRALRLAERGRGRTSPNPPVGALVVRDGAIVGRGWHKGPGSPHAEIEALDEAGDRAQGATLYVTLAPCTRYGRTPPCVTRVLSSGVACVVVGTADPNPSEGKGSVSTLLDAGIDVVTGVLEEEARALIAGFAMLVRTGRPAVTLKVATSLDGRVAASDGSSRWITGPAARRDVHRLRAFSDAVMIGIGTVLADDPALTCRLRGYDGPQPMRVVLDSTARTPLDAKVMDGAASTIIAVSAKATDEAERALVDRGAEVLRFASSAGRVDVASVLDALGRRGMTEILVEGGPTLAGELVERGLVDRFVFYIAPRMLGHLGLPAIAGLVVANIADALELTFTSVRRIGADMKIEARPRI